MRHCTVYVLYSILIEWDTVQYMCYIVFWLNEIQYTVQYMCNIVFWFNIYGPPHIFSVVTTSWRVSSVEHHRGEVNSRWVFWVAARHHGGWPQVNYSTWETCLGGNILTAKSLAVRRVVRCHGGRVWGRWRDVESSSVSKQGCETMLTDYS